VVSTAQISATVQAIDYSSREVAVKGPKGNIVALKWRTTSRASPTSISATGSPWCTRGARDGDAAGRAEGKADAQED